MRSRIAWVLVTAVLFGCGGGSSPTQPPSPPPGPPPPPAVSTVLVAPATATLVPTQTQAITATPRDAGNNALTGRTVTWQSTQTGVATVSGDGLVTAVERGTTQITATSEGKSGTATITVVDGAVVGSAGGTIKAPDSVTVLVPAGALAANRTITIRPVPNPAADPKLIGGTAFEFGPEGTTFTQPVTITIKYAAGAVPVAVDAANLRLHRYTGTAWQQIAGSTSNPGARTVTGQTSSFSIYAVLEVRPAVASVTVAAPQTTLAIDGQTTATVRVADAQDNELIGRTITWASTAATVASVSNTGVITALTAGTATISATSEGKSGSVAMTVVPKAQYASISLGDTHGCAVGANGAGYCWGQSESGDGTAFDRGGPTMVTGGINFAKVRVSDGGSAGITADGAIYSWGRIAGDGSETIPLVPSPATLPAPASYLGASGPGSGTYCAIIGGESYCWGRVLTNLGAPRQLLPTKIAGSVLGLVAVEVGGAFACGLKSNGQVYCWGARVGNPLSLAATPELVPGTEVFTQITAGPEHMCALSSTKDAWCWGLNGGRLGDGTTVNRATPVKVVGGHKFTSLTAGDSHSCGVTENGDGYCWGLNYAGELGDGTRTQRNSPVKVLAVSFQAIAAGSFATCGISTIGALHCWGSDEGDMTADGTLSYSLIPLETMLTDSAKRFAIRRAGGCAIDRTNDLYCWGYLADFAPSPVKIGGDFTDVDVNGNGSLVAIDEGFACALGVDQKAYCWGANDVGQLGVGDVARRATPTLAAGGVQLSEVVLGGAKYGCGIRVSDKKAICWGRLGAGTNTVPVPVAGNRSFHGLSSGFNEVCAVEEVTATVFCWSPGGTPTVISAERYASWSTGGSHGCGITEAGVTKCKGQNSAGQIGDGTTTTRAVPTTVSGVLAFRSVKAGNSGTTCGVTLDDDLYCWGANGQGTLGDGSRTSRPVPTRIAANLEFQSVVLGDAESCASTLTGDLHCWGLNIGGALGAGRPPFYLSPRIVPAAVSFLATSRR